MQNLKLKVKIQKFIFPFVMVGMAILLRLIPHPPNVAPIAAMALFGGVYLDKKYALVVPLIALFFSDIFLGFHNTMVFVYASFLFTGCIGLFLAKKKTFKNILAASIFSSLLFFIITNFGVWLGGSIYPKTFSGFIQCYFYAIPFFRNTLFGDFLYVGIFFGSYEFILHTFFSRSTVKHS